MSKPDSLAAYTVRNIKTFIGMEGHGFNATLCRDGKPIAFVIDDANGGPLNFQWTRGEVTEWELLRKLCAEVPPTLFEGALIAFDMDQLLYRLVDEYETEKRLKRMAKKKTLFRVKGDTPDEWRMLNVTGEKATAFLAKKYGEQLETVYGQGTSS